MELRLFEIDADPVTIASEIEKMLGPILTAAQSQVEFKAGELPDADYPTSHSSYYVGFRCRPEAGSEVAAGTLIAEITQFCNLHRLPIVEVMPQHREFANLVAEFGWASPSISYS